MPARGEEGGPGGCGVTPAPIPPTDRAEPSVAPYLSRKPHSSTEKPHLFLWTHFNLTKSANY